MNPSDVSATAPAQEDWITGPAFMLVLVRPGQEPPLEVVKVGYEAGELENWYKVEVHAGRLVLFRPVPDFGRFGSEDGGIWEIPPGQAVCPGMKLARSSTP